MRVRAALFLLCFVLSIVAVSAVPPFQTSGETTNSLTVTYPKLSAFPAGVSANLNFHVFDVNGTPLSNTTTNCTFHLYEANGSHVVEQALAFDGSDWEITLNGSQLSRVGEHPFVAFCQKSVLIGGFVSGAYVTTIDGVDETGDDLLPIGIIILIPLFLSFLFVVGAGLFDPEEHPMLRVGFFLAGVIFVFASLWYAGEALVKFYDWPAGVSTLSTLTYVIAAILSFIILYWLLYVVVKVIEAVKEKKEANY